MACAMAKFRPCGFGSSKQPVTNQVFFPQSLLYFVAAIIQLALALPRRLSNELRLPKFSSLPFVKRSPSLVFCCFVLIVSPGTVFAHNPRLPPVIPLDDIATIAINASTCSPQPLPDIDVNTPFRPSGDEWRALYENNPYRPQAICGHWSDCRLRCIPCVSGACRCAEVQFVGCYTYLPFTRVLIEINVERCADRIVRNFTSITGVGVVRERQCDCERFDPGPRPQATPTPPYPITTGTVATTRQTTEFSITTTSTANLIEEVGIFARTSIPASTAASTTLSTPTPSITTAFLLTDTATTTYDALKPCKDLAAPGNTLCSSMSTVKCSWPLFISVCCGTCGRLYDEELMRHANMNGSCIDSPPEPGYCQTHMSRGACCWPLSMRRCCATCSTTYGVDENEVGSSLDMDDADDRGENWADQGGNQFAEDRPMFVDENQFSFAPFDRPLLGTTTTTFSPVGDRLTTSSIGFEQTSTSWSVVQTGQGASNDQESDAFSFQLDGSDRPPEVLQVHLPTVRDQGNGSYEVTYESSPVELHFAVPDQTDTEAFWTVATAASTTPRYSVVDEPYDENAVYPINDDDEEPVWTVDQSEDDQETTTEEYLTRLSSPSTTTQTTTTMNIVTSTQRPAVAYESMPCFDSPRSRELCNETMNITLCAWPLYSYLCCETCSLMLREKQIATTAVTNLQVDENEPLCADDVDHQNFCPRMNKRTCRWPVSRQLCCGTCRQFEENGRRRRRSEYCADKWSPNKCIGHANAALCTGNSAFASNCCSTCRQLLVRSASKKHKRTGGVSSCVDDASTKQYCSKIKMSSCRHPIALNLCCSKCRVLL